MSSDRARNTYAPMQQYRAVIAQQGRVNIDPDWNEGQDILTESIRMNTLDIIGPVGSPDDGYKVYFDPQLHDAPDFGISKGTMYVGGERLELTENLSYFGQKKLDWVNGPDEPPKADGGFEAVLLYVREQEVSAVEDRDLREVALGGPDTTQRKRFLQRIWRREVASADCEQAEGNVTSLMMKSGYVWDPKTCRLVSNARLKVGFAEDEDPADKCEPAAHGGYLGAENQFIRVKVVGYSDDQKRVRFVWGFDGASHLFRVVVDVLNSKKVKLDRPPVDSFHWPRAGQAVELLQAAALLSNGEHVAENRGFVSSVAADFDSDELTITMDEGAPLAQFPAEQTDPPIFLRLWEEVLEADLGEAVQLGATGIEVTISAKEALLPIGVGDYWAFAVRPSTPQTVYPQRYVDERQPPEGPRQWLALLGTLTWKTRNRPEVHDCREVFDNLVELTKRRGGGCCTILLKPEDAPKVHDIIELAKGGALRKVRISLCFTPGIYELDKPIKLDSTHSKISFDACCGDVRLRPKAETMGEFSQGVFQLAQAQEVAIDGFTIDMPLASLKNMVETEKGADREFLRSSLKAQFERIQASIGIHAADCDALQVKRCIFLYPKAGPEEQLIAVGVMLGGSCERVKVDDNRFLNRGGVAVPGGRELRTEAGIVVRPISVRGKDPATGEPTGTFVPDVLHDASICGNEFEGLAGACSIMALFGNVTIAENHVNGCYHGFVIKSLGDVIAREGIGATTVPENLNAPARKLATRYLKSSDDPVLAPMSLTRSMPVPEAFLTGGTVVKGADLTKAVATDPKVMQPMMDALSEGAPPTTGPAPKRVEVVSLIKPAPRTRGDSLAGFKEVEAKLTAAEKFALAKVDFTKLTPRLHINDNVFDCAPEQEQGGQCLMMNNFPQPPGSSVTLDANYFRNKSQDACVELIGFERMTITGNQLLNEAHTGKESADIGTSLDIFMSGAKDWLLTATGNAFLGDTNLRNIKRPENFGGQLDNWMFANSLRR